MFFDLDECNADQKIELTKKNGKNGEKGREKEGKKKNRKNVK